VKLMSLGFLIDRDAPAIWRGPIIMKIVQQFLRDVAWGELDYFIVDLPPGTGDAQLSLVQSCHVASAVIVTTPQEVAVGDALRGAKMFEKVNVPVAGVIENMSPWTDPATGQRFEMFGSGGGQRASAEELRCSAGSVPLQPGLADAADRESRFSSRMPPARPRWELDSIAERLAGILAVRPSLPVLQG
jgi:ATP-binding protein involved in chromosome partitioning